jgi:surface antigen
MPAWVKIAAMAMALTCVNSENATAHAREHWGGWQCVTYAQTHSGVALRGNAHTWWDHAAGVYDRSHQPAVGAVMVMKSYPAGGMPMGHVAIVSRIVRDREVLLTHANWQGDGSVETNVRAIDVSPAGDWSQVRVWFAPVHAMGLKSFPTYGFILPVRGGHAPSQQSPELANDQPSATELAFADPHG